MPTIQIPASSHSGDLPFEVFFQISTPTLSEAQKVDPCLPILLFLHPEFYSKGIFHPHFKNHSLRRFNLITMEFRHHGDTGGVVWDGFKLEDMAEDVFRFLIALDLPPVHIVGLSMGASVALWLSIHHPERVRTCTLMSMLSPVETPEVIAGRAEFQDAYAEAMITGKDFLLQHSVFGIVQMSRSRIWGVTRDTRIGKYLTRPQSVARWYDADTCLWLRRLSHDAVVNRTVFQPSDLAKLAAPVLIFHGRNDFCYPISVATDLQQAMSDAGVKKTHLVLIQDAPHHCNIGSAASEEINARLTSFVLSHTNLDGASLPIPLEPVVSPWQAVLFPPEEDIEGWDEEI